MNIEAHITDLILCTPVFKHFEMDFLAISQIQWKLQHFETCMR